MSAGLAACRGLHDPQGPVVHPRVIHAAVELGAGDLRPHQLDLAIGDVNGYGLRPGERRVDASIAAVYLVAVDEQHHAAVDDDRPGLALADARLGARPELPVAAGASVLGDRTGGISPG